MDKEGFFDKGPPHNGRGEQDSFVSPDLPSPVHPFELPLRDAGLRLFYSLVCCSKLKASFICGMFAIFRISLIGQGRCFHYCDTFPSCP